MLGNQQFVNGSYMEIWWKEKGIDGTVSFNNTGSFEIIGTITPTSIDFDPEPFLKERWTGQITKKGKLITAFIDFNDETITFQPEKSFRSAIEAAGIAEYEKLLIIQKQ